jgi:hypothetical protein
MRLLEIKLRLPLVPTLRLYVGTDVDRLLAQIEVGDD